LVVVFAGVLRAVVAFVARVRVAGAFAVVVLLAAAGLAVVFDAAFTEAALTGAALVGAGLVSLGAGVAPRTMSLKPLRGVMRAFLDALILMARRWPGCVPCGPWSGSWRTWRNR